MRVYKVSPILKYSPFFSLTYVSKENFEIGDILPINFNNREIFAAVLQSFSLKDAKVEIRKADFRTKKIEKRSSKMTEKFLHKNFSDLFKILQNFSKTNTVSVGELVWFLFEDKFILQNFSEDFEDIITYYPDQLSLKLNKSKSNFCGNKIFKEILEKKFQTLIIKDFNFDKYLDFQSPHIPKLDLLFGILKEMNLVKKIILETDFLGVVEKNFLNENVIDGKFFGKYELEIKEKNNFAKKFLVKVGHDKNGEEEIFTSEALEKISRKGKNFFFVLSHGFADRIFCNDCRKSYDCEKCESQFSILNEEQGRFLFCKNCKNKKVLLEDQYLICKHCGSWRIFPFGIGGQKLAEFLQKENKKNILIDESEKKLTVKKIKEKIENFLQNEEENILIGSLRVLKVLQNLNAKVDKTFVISTGPLTRGKYFDSDEKLLKLISEIENISQEVYINKRDGDEISLENYKDKEKFIKEEIDFRKKNNLPPATKVLSLIFNYKNKRHLDKFLLQNLGEFKNSGETKKGKNFVYFWFVKQDSEILKMAEILRQFGDVISANSIFEQSILGKK